jgi:hypothetical protein
MKTLTIDELVTLNRLLTTYSVQSNNERAKLLLPLKRFRICPTCKEITEKQSCSCKKEMH